MRGQGSALREGSLKWEPGHQREKAATSPRALDKNAKRMSIASEKERNAKLSETLLTNQRDSTSCLPVGCSFVCNLPEDTPVRAVI